MPTGVDWTGQKHLGKSTGQGDIRKKAGSNGVKKMMGSSRMDEVGWMWRGDGAACHRPLGTMLVMLWFPWLSNQPANADHSGTRKPSTRSNPSSWTVPNDGYSGEPDRDPTISFATTGRGGGRGRGRSWTMGSVSSQPVQCAVTGDFSALRNPTLPRAGGTFATTSAISSQKVTGIPQIPQILHAHCSKLASWLWQPNLA